MMVKVSREYPGPFACYVGKIIGFNDDGVTLKFEIKVQNKYDNATIPTRYLEVTDDTVLSHLSSTNEER